MSLNRCEDALLDYMRARKDEHRFWTERVLAIDRAGGSLVARTAALERELRDYAAERSHADVGLADAIGAGRVSLRNLAEYLLATWTPPRARPRRGA